MKVQPRAKKTPKAMASLSHCAYKDRILSLYYQINRECGGPFKCFVYASDWIRAALSVLFASLDMTIKVHAERGTIGLYSDRGFTGDRIVGHTEVVTAVFFMRAITRFHHCCDVFEMEWGGVHWHNHYLVFHPELPDYDPRIYFSIWTPGEDVLGKERVAMRHRSAIRFLYVYILGLTNRRITKFSFDLGREKRLAEFTRTDAVVMPNREVLGQLEFLRLSRIPPGHTVPILEVLADSLRTLELDYTAADDSSLQIEHWDALRNLRELKITGRALRMSDWQRLLGDPNLLPSLETLSVEAPSTTVEIWNWLLNHAPVREKHLNVTVLDGGDESPPSSRWPSG